jgi:hypothetical protein
MPSIQLKQADEPKRNLSRCRTRLEFHEDLSVEFSRVLPAVLVEVEGLLISISKNRCKEVARDKT